MKDDIMKQAIEKAIENDYDIVQAAVGLAEEACEEDKEHVYILDEDEGYHVLNIYQCIFGTNLVECLVGEGYYVCISTAFCDDCNEFGEDKECASNQLQNADYHRSQMANLPDIKAIKQYIKTNLMEVEV